MFGQAIAKHQSAHLHNVPLVVLKCPERQAKKMNMQFDVFGKYLCPTRFLKESHEMKFYENMVSIRHKILPK